MVAVSDENEVKRKADRQANRKSTVDLGHSAPLMLCGTVGSCWAQPPEHPLLPDTKEETSSNCPLIVKWRALQDLMGRHQFLRAAT